MRWFIKPGFSVKVEKLNGNAIKGICDPSDEFIKGNLKADQQQIVEDIMRLPLRCIWESPYYYGAWIHQGKRGSAQWQYKPLQTLLDAAWDEFNKQNRSGRFRQWMTTIMKPFAERWLYFERKRVRGPHPTFYQRIESCPDGTFVFAPWPLTDDDSRLMRIADHRIGLDLKKEEHQNLIRRNTPAPAPFEVNNIRTNWIITGTFQPATQDAQLRRSGKRDDIPLPDQWETEQPFPASSQSSSSAPMVPQLEMQSVAVAAELVLPPVPEPQRLVQSRNLTSSPEQGNPEYVISPVSAASSAEVPLTRMVRGTTVPALTRHQREGTVPAPRGRQAAIDIDDEEEELC